MDRGHIMKFAMGYDMRNYDRIITLDGQEIARLSRREAESMATEELDGWLAAVVRGAIVRTYSNGKVGK